MPAPLKVLVVPSLLASRPSAYLARLEARRPREHALRVRLAAGQRRPALPSPRPTPGRASRRVSSEALP
jgi:hypothetical protein